MDTRRKELADFIQMLRQRSAPADFGFAVGNRRRTAGLRREEMAQLAGISPTWYTWLEQARAVNVSAEVLDRLAIALRLNRSERAYLFEMADRHDAHSDASEDEALPASLCSLLREIDSPAYLLGRYWDILDWNAAAADLFTGWLDQHTPGQTPAPNMLRFVFLREATRPFLVDWEDRARRICAEFRADCASFLEDPPIQRLLGELSASAEFALFWKQHKVLERQGGERTFLHPLRGPLIHHQTTLRPIEPEHIKLVVLQPVAAQA